MTIYNIYIYIYISKRSCLRQLYFLRVFSCVICVFWELLRTFARRTRVFVAPVFVVRYKTHCNYGFRIVPLFQGLSSRIRLYSVFRARVHKILACCVAHTCVSQGVLRMAAWARCLHVSSGGGSGGWVGQILTRVLCFYPCALIRLEKPSGILNCSYLQQPSIFQTP